MFIQRNCTGCDCVQSVDGENTVCTAWEDVSQGNVTWYATHDQISDEVDKITNSGCVVLGLLRRVEGKWTKANEWRQQGPIDSPGGKDASRIANAISLNGVYEQSGSQKLRKALCWSTFWVTTALLLWTLVWWWNYFIPPQVPYRVIMEPNKDVRGPIIGRTYKDGEFRIAVTDRKGAPIRGLDVVFELTQPGAGPFAVFLGAPTPADRSAGETEVFRNRIVVKTNDKGIADPQGLRFKQKSFRTKVDDKTIDLVENLETFMIKFEEAKLGVEISNDSTAAAANEALLKAKTNVEKASELLNTAMADLQPIQMSIFVPNTPLPQPVISRTLKPVASVFNDVRFVGNFEQSNGVNLIEEIHEFQRVNVPFRIQAQIVNKKENKSDPVSLSGLAIECKLRKFDVKDEGIKYPLVHNQSLAVTHGTHTVSEYGVNSWVTVDVSVKDLGTYWAQIDIKKGGKTMKTADLIFKVIE